MGCGRSVALNFSYTRRSLSERLYQKQEDRHDGRAHQNRFFKSQFACHSHHQSSYDDYIHIKNGWSVTTL